MINRSTCFLPGLFLAFSVFTGTFASASSYPTFSINNSTVTEADAGMTKAEFVVTLSAPASEVLAVRYATAEIPGSSRPDDYANQSATAGSDFVQTNGVLTFNPGETSKKATVSIVGDEVHEYNEGFAVYLTQASPAPIDRGNIRAVILNDDLLEITINNVTVMEGHDGTTVANFVISLSRESDQYVVGSWFTASSSAQSEVDHRGGGGSMHYSSAPEGTNIFLPISIIGDKDIEEDETFFVNLSVLWGTDVRIGNPGQCTIKNDDFFLKTESCTTEEITFRLEGAAGATHVLEYSTNFIHWTPVSTNTLFSDKVLYFATENKKQGFYRATLQQ